VPVRPSNYESGVSALSKDSSIGGNNTLCNMQHGCPTSLALPGIFNDETMCTRDYRPPCFLTISASSSSILSHTGSKWGLQAESSNNATSSQSYSMKTSIIEKNSSLLNSCKGAGGHICAVYNGGLSFSCSIAHSCLNQYTTQSDVKSVTGGTSNRMQLAGTNFVELSNSEISDLFNTDRLNKQQ
jgi:hypothetical protein